MRIISSPISVFVVTRLLVKIALFTTVFITQQSIASNVAAKVQFVTGDVSASSSKGEVRLLKKGDRIYAGDTIKSGENGAAQLIYKDRSRMAVRVNTSFKIEVYNYDKKDATKSRSFFSLISGALRSITGIIGQKRKASVSIRTPLATIGIRGTDHEVVHIAQPRGGLKAIADVGTYDKVYSGGTFMVTERGTVNLGLKEVGFVGGTPGKLKKPVKLRQLPKAIEKHLIKKVPIQAKKKKQTKKVRKVNLKKKRLKKRAVLKPVLTTTTKDGAVLTKTGTTSSTTLKVAPTTSKTPVLSPTLVGSTRTLVQPVLTAPLKTEPILTSPTLKSPIVEPVLRAPAIAPVLTTPIIEPIIKTPVIEPVIKAPVIDPVLTAPIIEPVIKAPVLKTPVFRTPLLTK